MASPTTYQRVTTATDYDATVGNYYLKFDGLDDSLSTASIDFSGGDKMTVWAGVRKLSDATAGILCELSVSVISNAGSFYFAAPEATGASGNFTFKSGGTLQPASASSSGVMVSPVTKVITGIGDIAGRAQTIRINSVQTATIASSQGTGNYGNYPLYIGRRGGTSVPANIHLYSLIVRGAQSTDAQIASAESYVNGKTSAF